LSERFSDYAKELNKNGVTKLLLWEEYRKENPEGYEYTQFKHYLNQHLDNKKIPIIINTRHVMSCRSILQEI